MLRNHKVNLPNLKGFSCRFSSGNEKKRRIWIELIRLTSNNRAFMGFHGDTNDQHWKPTGNSGSLTANNCKKKGFQIVFPHGSLLGLHGTTVPMALANGQSAEHGDHVIHGRPTKNFTTRDANNYMLYHILLIFMAYNKALCGYVSLKCWTNLCSLAGIARVIRKTTTKLPIINQQLPRKSYEFPCWIHNLPWNLQRNPTRKQSESKWMNVYPINPSFSWWRSHFSSFFPWFNG